MMLVAWLPFEEMKGILEAVNKVEELLVTVE